MLKKSIALLLAVLMALSCVSALAENTKHERVYVVSDADGQVKSLTDNIRLENADGLEQIVDATLLTHIQNLSGEETFTLEGETLTWQANGRDIIYQGESDKTPATLPTVSLTLDGQAVTAAELREKTGEAVLTVSYPGSAQMPAMAVSAILLPEQGVSSLTLHNAAVFTEMGRQVLVGWAVPGMPEQLSLPASFSASFHADHADLSWMMTLVTSDPIERAFNEADARISCDPSALLSEAAALLTAVQNGETLPDTDPNLRSYVQKINELNAGLTTLDDSALKLADGAKELSSGVNTLKDGAGQVKTGAAQLRDGAASLKDGIDTAAQGAEALQAGLSTLAGQNDALNAGAAQLFAAALDTANAQIAAAGLEKMGVALPTLTAENYAEVLDGMIAKLKALPAAAPVCEKLTALKTQLDQLNTFVNGLGAYTAGVAQAQSGAAQLKDGMTQLSTGAASLQEGATTLADGAASLSKGVFSLQQGAVTLSFGAKTLQSMGTSQLKASLLAAEKEISDQLLPLVRDTLPDALRLYDETRNNVRNAGFDLRPEGMKTVTVCIVRTDL